VKYPFTPAVLDVLPEELAGLFRALEITLLEEISKRLTVDKLNMATVADIKALRAHGISLDEITKTVKATTGISDRKLNELLADVVKKNQVYYGSVLDLAGLTAPRALVGASVVNSIVRQTAGELKNITRSMGFLVDDGRTMLPPAKAYQWALDNAIMQIESEAISYGEAVDNATRVLADSGLQVVDYESGVRNHVDVAVRRAVMTGVNQINRAYDEQGMEYLQTDLVEVSAHAGARDKGDGFENHKAWQGKVYRWRRYTRMFPDASKGNYPDFEIECGYGDVQGILGANCRHKWTPFVEGVMERTYSDAELANIDKPPFEYEGVTYTTYEATQTQRKIETAIRHWKRRAAAAVTPSAELAAKSRIRILNDKYREFSEAAGLRMQKQRANVYIKS